MKYLRMNLRKYVTYILRTINIAENYLRSHKLMVRDMVFMNLKTLLRSLFPKMFNRFHVISLKISVLLFYRNFGAECVTLSYMKE